MTPNTVLLDREGTPLGPAILYCDSRSIDIHPEVYQFISEEQIIALNGFPLGAHGGWQGGQLLWIRRHRPEQYKHAVRMLGTTNFLVFKLTGQFVADYALAHCNVPFYNQTMRTWSLSTCQLLGIPVGLFPDRVGYSAEIAGTVTANAAKECGLLEGTPVILGTMDTNADMVAAGVTAPGDVGLAYGTALLGAKCLTQPSIDGAYANDYVVPDRFLFGSGIGTGGALTKWFRDAFGLPEIQAEARGGPNAFAALSELASQVPPGSDDLIVVPLFGGRRVLLGNRVPGGTIIGLTTFHGRAHLYRATLEGTCFETRRQLETIAPWVPVTRISSVGGGTKNRAWTQIMTDVLGAEQHCFPETAGAPYGDAYLAGVGIGLFRGFAPLRESWTRGGYVTKVDEQAHQAYNRAYCLYLDAIRLLHLEKAF